MVSLFRHPPRSLGTPPCPHVTVPATVHTAGSAGRQRPGSKAQNGLGRGGSEV